MALSYPYLFRQLVREEWRLHAALFGGRRFALFPLFVAAIAAGTSAFLAWGGTDPAAPVAGVHALVAVMGLHVGTVGLVGRDALENLLGDTALLVFSARTLPVSTRRLLLAFLLKDVAYYAGLFVAPLVVGLAPLSLAGYPLSRLPLVFLTTSWTFAAGVGVSLALVGLYTRSRPLALLPVVVAVPWYPAAAVPYTPYGLLAGVTLAGVAGSLALVTVPAAVGVALFDTERRTPARTAGNRFRWLHARLGGLDRQGALAKSLLDLHRSSGGAVKLLFSQGLVFAVVAGLLAYLPNVVPVRPSPGLALAAVLALGAFTTYNWLCQFDDEAFYGRYPLALSTVFRAKLVAYGLLALPVGLAYLALGAAVFGVESLAVGFLAYPALAVYVFGVTAYVAGLRPTELLFDTPTFALFSAAVVAVLLPVVVAAIVYPVAPLAVGVGSITFAVVAAGIGFLLYRRAGPRWTRRARSGA
jgi:hypothetical protein